MFLQLISFKPLIMNISNEYQTLLPDRWEIRKKEIFKVTLNESSFYFTTTVIISSFCHCLFWLAFHSDDIKRIFGKFFLLAKEKFSNRTDEIGEGESPSFVTFQWVCALLCCWGLGFSMHACVCLFLFTSLCFDFCTKI